MITAAAIRAALALYDGWTYAPKNAKGGRDCFYPAESRVCALYLSQAGHRQTDCCCFVEGVVLAAAGPELGRWPKARHKRAMIASEEQVAALDRLQLAVRKGSAPYRDADIAALHGLPDELVAVGLADVVSEATDEPAVGEWWVGQLWDRDWGQGHAVLLEGGEEAWIVHEASKSAGRVISRAVTAWPVPGGWWRRWARLLVG